MRTVGCVLSLACMPLDAVRAGDEWCGTVAFLMSSARRSTCAVVGLLNLRSATVTRFSASTRISVLPSDPVLSRARVVRPARLGLAANLPLLLARNPAGTVARLAESFAERLQLVLAKRLDGGGARLNHHFALGHTQHPVIMDSVEKVG